MLEFELDYLRKIRLWFSPNTDVKLPLTNQAQGKSYFAQIDKHSNFTTLIVELFIPKGGRNVYGLLGVSYIPKLIANLDVNISCSNINNNIFKQSLIGSFEPVYVSFPHEYCNAIFNKIDSVSTHNNLKLSGELNFCYGAVSEVSSSLLVFEKLTYLIINLLNISEDKIDAHLLNKLVND